MCNLQVLLPDSETLPNSTLCRVTTRLMSRPLSRRQTTNTELKSQSPKIHLFYKMHYFFSTSTTWSIAVNYMDQMATRKMSAHDTVTWRYLSLVYTRLVTFPTVCNRLLQDLPQVFRGAKNLSEAQISTQSVPCHDRECSAWVTEILGCWIENFTLPKPAVCPATCLCQALRATRNLNRGQSPYVELSILWGDSPVTYTGSSTSLGF